jgi:hypothetical protein
MADDGPDSAGKSAKAVGRPWPKGVSGNPSGRAKVPEHVKSAARAHTELAIATLAEVCQTGTDGARVSAAVALLDRAWGKPEQHVDLSTTDDTADELRQAIVRLRQDPATASAVLLIANRASVTSVPEKGD